MVKIVFRADGSPTVGLGHIYRLMAFYELVTGKYQKLFIVNSVSPISQFEEEIDYLQVPFTNSEEEVEWIKENFDPTNVILVLDGYNFNEDYQAKLKSIGFRIIFVDDHVAFTQHADIVLNHALGVTSSCYHSMPYTRYALGSDFALLRKAFLEVVYNDRKLKDIDTILVCFGGADPLGLTERMINMITRISSVSKINVILGGSNETFKDNFNLIGTQLVVYRNLNASEMINVMLESDLAIASSSTISYELCCCQTPMICGYFIDNQRLIYEGLKTHKVMIPIGDFRDVSDHQIVESVSMATQLELRLSMVESQRKLFRKPVSRNISELIDDLC